MNLRQGQDLELLFKLEDSVPAPVTGALFSDLIVQYWKPGETSFQIRAILEEEFTELSGGWYTLKLNGENDLNTLGQYYLGLSALTSEVTEKEFLVEVPPVGINPDPAICVVSGNIVDIGGEPGKGQNIYFRPVAFPTASGQSMVTSDKVVTVPDAAGNFSVNLLRGQTVVVEIERTGIRSQFEVPDQDTALLLDLLPPLS